MSADLDKAIDGAVREMLDVEPPAGLRGRVMARIESPRVSTISRKVWWIAAPIAAAAALLLAVNLWPRHESPVLSAASTRRSDVHLPGDAASRPASSSSTPSVAEVQPSPDHVRAVVTARERQAVTAADVADESPVAGFPRVPAITIQELSVPQIRKVEAARATEPLGVDPIATPAPIDLEPLTLSPRERHDQE